MNKNYVFWITYLFLTEVDRNILNISVNSIKNSPGGHVIHKETIFQKEIVHQYIFLGLTNICVTYILTIYITDMCSTGH
jgi:hypothetical protein